MVYPFFIIFILTYLYNIGSFCLMIGIWTHVIAKYDASQGRSYLFVNGEKSIKLKNVKKGAKLPWGDDIVIGGLTDESGKATFPFLGGMLDMRFVEKPYNDAEIDAAYKHCEPEDAGI